MLVKARQEAWRGDCNLTLPLSLGTSISHYLFNPRLDLRDQYQVPSFLLIVPISCLPDPLFNLINLLK